MVQKLIVSEETDSNTQKRRSPRRRTNRVDSPRGKRRPSNQKDISQLFANLSMVTHEDDLWSSDAMSAAFMNMAIDAKRRRSKNAVPSLPKNDIDTAEKFMVTSLGTVMFS